MRKKLFFDKTLSLSFLLFCLFIATASGIQAGTRQDTRKYKVTGVVKDDSGEFVIGASVIEKGTTNGVITDMEGNFALIVSPNSTLSVSFVGYTTQEFLINQDGMNLSVFLPENSEMIEEVVVVGYGVQKKENLTGSVAAVRFDDLASMPVANTTNILQGRLPGVVLTGNGAQAGHDSPEIRIRGVGTLGSAGKNNPMVLIDGVESSIAQMADLPPMMSPAYPY